MDEQLPIELILVRQLAGYLATPVFVIDGAARLVYYNEAAEELLGGRFEDTNLVGRDEWLSAFAPHDVDGTPFTPEDDPLLSALADGRERHRTLAVTGLDGRERSIEATLLPLVGQAGRVLGAVAVFWPADR
jgi:PAS domain-containing protein